MVKIDPILDNYFYFLFRRLLYYFVPNLVFSYTRRNRMDNFLRLFSSTFLII